MENNSLYEILGVSPNADPAVIKAAYKTLASKYHPDKNHQNSAQSNIKMADINEAYRVLSSKELRMEYDSIFINTKKNPKDFINKPYYNAFINDKSLLEKWIIAESHYPKLKAISKKLYLISEDLFINYAHDMLKNKSYDAATIIAEQQENNYLREYFGKNLRAQYFAKELLIKGHTSAAMKLNSIITTLDESIDIISIEKSICREFNIELFYKHYLNKINTFDKNNPIRKAIIVTEKNDGINFLGLAILVIVAILVIAFI